MTKLPAMMVGVIVLIVNPFFACTADEPEFQYGAAEMRAAIEGTWTLTLPATSSGGSPRELTLEIEQASDGASASAAREGLVRPAAACGHRTFVQSAEACIDVTEMPLLIRVREGTAPERVVDARFEVLGLRFEAGLLDTQADTDALSLHARVSAAGEASDVGSIVDGRSVAATMVRIATPQ